jgi:signal transduction histidine kinase
MHEKSQHRLLSKQIEKYLTAECLRHPNFVNFIKAVNNSYYAFERDKELLEHAAALNEKEYAEINQQLVDEIQSRNISIDKILGAIELLGGKNAAPHESNNAKLESLIEVLQNQIAKQKIIELQLIEAKEAAQSANKAKSEFLSIMSHEIRTPLNGIIGLTHLIFQEEMPEHLAEKLNILKFSAENLHLLINDILDYSKIDAGKLEIEETRFNVKKLISNIKKANSGKAIEKGIQIKLMIDDDIPDELIGDQLRIGQVITNLVSNAVKFTKKGSVTIELQLKKLNSDKATLFFSIKDTGIGIPKDKQSLIFNEFTQSNSSITREFGGTGLGLVICKKILELYHSDLLLESEEGKGATFYFTIDLNIAKENLDVLQKNYSGEYNLDLLKGLKVLLVEDHSINILMSVMYFKKWNMEYEIAENGQLALDKFQSGKYDIILMDLQMPVLDGISTAFEIRKLDQQIPIIALTASATYNTIENAREAGMNDYIIKPFYPNDLVYKILKLTGRI